jgi:hypothetical protein
MALIFEAVMEGDGNTVIVSVTKSIQPLLDVTCKFTGYLPAVEKE